MTTWQGHDYQISMKQASPRRVEKRDLSFVSKYEKHKHIQNKGSYDVYEINKDYNCNPKIATLFKNRIE